MTGPTDTMTAPMAAVARRGRVRQSARRGRTARQGQRGGRRAGARRRWSWSGPDGIEHRAAAGAFHYDRARRLAIARGGRRRHQPSVNLSASVSLPIHGGNPRAPEGRGAGAWGWQETSGRGWDLGELAAKRGSGPAAPEHDPTGCAKLSTGGRARAEGMTAEERAASARKAAAERQAKSRGSGSNPPPR
jgi:hypothetical protein